jgi:NAD-dependent DNA ligase
VQAGVPNIGAQIQEGIDAMAPVIDQLLAAGVTVRPAERADASATTGSADSPAARTVCISGKLPSGRKKADYEAPLRAAGYTLVDEVRQGLSCLVLADPEATSSKSTKARKLGIEVISEDRLKALVGEAD